MDFAFHDFVILIFADMMSNSNEIFSDPLIVGILILIGLVVGMAIGLSGLGGAPLLLPPLILIGIPPQLVIGANLAFIFGTKLFASVLHSKENNINWKALGFLLIPVVPVMLLASWVWTEIKDNYGSDVLDTAILLILGILLLATSLYMIKNNVLKQSRDNAEFSTHHNFFFPRKMMKIRPISVAHYLTS